MQTVIEFLSHSQSYSETGDGEDHFPSEPYGVANYRDTTRYMEGKQREWGQSKAEPPKPTPAHSDNSSSGSSGVGTDDGYRHDVAAGSSRSTSMSPGMDGKGIRDGRGKGEELGDDSSHYSMKGSYDSGINLHSRPSKKKGWDRDPGTDKLDPPHSKELSLDFSKGFGSLIPSDPGGQGGSSDLSYGMGMLDLSYLKGMTGDSDSEISG